MTVEPDIALDPTEEKLVSLLVGCSDWINATQPQPSLEDGGSVVDYSRGAFEVRIAGGWVRDKLLGLPSHDLDVSVSVMTGLNFAILFKQYLLASPSSLPSSESSVTAAATSAMSRITKIAANPEQSKNLETATANILGLDLDFVNLRKEVYEGDSRIPIMSFGTPKEDAERRDITINSLFYNVKSRAVEDWTGKGLDDLRTGLVRTPLSPLTTFLDDPLRVLRCVRFASRFNYHLDETIVACLQGTLPPSTGSATAAHTEADPRLAGVTDPRALAELGGKLLRQALMTKVSRERVGIEVDKMLGGPFPLLAHLHLRTLGIYDLVFHPDALSQDGGQITLRQREWPQEPDAIVGNSQDISRVALDASLWLDVLSSVPISQRPPVSQSLHNTGFSWPAPTDAVALRSQLPSAIRDVLEDREQRRRMEFACSFLALGDQEIEEKKGRWVWVGEKVMMQGLKLGKNSTSLPVTSMTNAVALFARPGDLSTLQDRCQRHITQLPELRDPLSRKAALALLLRDRNAFNPAIDLYPSAAIALSLLKDLVASGARTAEEAGQIIEEYSNLLSLVHETGLLPRLDEKPLLDGNAVLKLLGLKPGPLTPRIQNAVLIWQLDNLQAPASSLSAEERASREAEVSAWLTRMWEAGLVVPSDERTVAAKPAGKKGAGGGGKQQQPTEGQAGRETKKQRSVER
ncbi:unnamed protein product [Parajaminaea phylloscopi]